MPIDSVPNGSAGALAAPPPAFGVLPNVYSTGFTRYVGPPGFLRIDATVSVDCYMQISEWTETGHFEDPVGDEFLLAAGTHSIPLVRRAYQWRLRSASSTVGVTFTIRTIG